MRAPQAAMLAVAAGLVLLAPAAGRAETVRPGEPFDGFELGLFGHHIPEVLQAAKIAPYAPPSAPACQTIPREIAALDAVLGPDADEPAERTKLMTRADRLLGSAVRSMIPHRDIVRLVTGAGRKDKALNEAAMAGWARRGYLKGLEANLACADVPRVVPAVAPAPASAVAAAAETERAPVLARTLVAAPVGPDAALPR
jgi:hypothetical protein